MNPPFKSKRQQCLGSCKRPSKEEREREREGKRLKDKKLELFKKPLLFHNSRSSPPSSPLSAAAVSPSPSPPPPLSRREPEAQTRLFDFRPLESQFLIVIGLYDYLTTPFLGSRPLNSWTILLCSRSLRNIRVPLYDLLTWILSVG